MKRSKRSVFLICIALIASTIIFCGLWMMRRHLQLHRSRERLVALLEQAQGTYDPARLILNDVDEALAVELAEQLGAQARYQTRGRIAVLTLPENCDVQQIASDRTYTPYLEHMMPDYYMTMSGTEIPTVGAGMSQALEESNLQNTWNTTTGAGITVAVIDTGIDTDHPSFQGRISKKSYNATLDQVVSDYNWSIIEDESGHGTATASIIAAAPDEATGISGVAPGVELLVIKCGTSEDATIHTSDVLFGLAYAIEQDVDVINLSFWGYSPENPYEAYTKLAVDSDIICIAAAGDKETSVLGWPAADENVIGVGALRDTSVGSDVSISIGNDGSIQAFTELSPMSNYGDNSDVVAPGEVSAIGLNGKIQRVSGTSVASAFVAGTTALYLSQNKYTEYESYRQMLFASTKDMATGGEDWYYGFGMLDIHALVVEEKGTITLDYLTDELSDRTQPFVVGHAVQYIDEPERDYAVFDGWYYDIGCTDEFDYLQEPLYQDITLYARWVNEDDSLPYTYRHLGDGTIEITGYRGKRRYISIPEQIDGYTVTSIGERALSGNARLRGVTLPETLKTIGNHAFSNCSQLLSIKIPGSVTLIGEHAFENDTRLMEVAIPSDGSLRSVGDYAFAYCGMLTRFDIPNHLEEISGLAFYSAVGMRQVTTTTECENFRIEDGALCRNTENGLMLVYHPAAIGGNYVIDNSVKILGKYAFAYSRLGYVELHDEIERIDCGCFTHSELTSVSLPGSIGMVPSNCFEYCDKLQTVSIGEGIWRIGPNAFSCCGVLKELNFPDTLTSIGEYAFQFAGQLQILYHEPALNDIGAYAFQCCSSLTNMDFAGDSITRIDSYAFSGSGIQRVSIPKTLTTLGAGVFNSCTRLSEVTFADAIVLDENTLREGLFSNCTSLTSILIPESIEIIESGCFSNTGLEAIHFSAGIQKIYPRVLSGCGSLTQITVDPDNATYFTRDQVLYFRDAETTELTLHTFPAGIGGTFNVPEDVSCIGSYAFAENRKILDVSLSASVKEIQEYAFSVAQNLRSLTYQEGLLQIGSHAFYRCEALSSQHLPNSLETIDPYAFAYCIGLETITVSKNLINIGYGAFENTKSLMEFTFPKDAAISRLGNSAFAGSGIRYFEVPASVTSMGQEIFRGCQELTEIRFAENSKLTALPAWAFRGADQLQTITFGEGAALESIQARALEYLDNLSSINLEVCTRLTNIDNYAFQFCTSLSHITLPDTVEYIGRYAFYCCASLTELKLPETVEYIGRYAFVYTNQIRIYFAASVLPEYLQTNWDHGIGGYYLGTADVIVEGDWAYALLKDGTISIVAYTGNAETLDLTTVFGYPVSAIGGHAFAGNATLESVVLPDTLCTICDEAFLNTTALREIHIPETVSFLGAGAFQGSGIASVTFADGIDLDAIHRHTFANTPNLTSISLPKTVQEIAEYAFYQSALESVDFSPESSLRVIGRYAFAESKLSALKLPDSLERIDYYGFSGIQNLKQVTFGTDRVLALYGYAFYNSGLESVYLPANVNYVGEFCFVNCQDLISFHVAEDSAYFMDADGILFNKEQTRLICCPAGKTGSYEIPAHVSVLNFAAFEGSSLSAVTIPEDSQLTTIGYRAFFNCDGITGIYIPAGVQSLDYYAFAYCSQLKTVTISEESRMCGIYEGAFYHCTAIESIRIPDTVKEISDFAFSGCSELKTVQISGSSELAGIFEEAFFNTSITSLHLPDSVMELGDRVFANTKLENLVIPEKTRSIGVGLLKGNTAITTVSVPFLGESYGESGTLGRLFDCSNTLLPESLTTVILSNTTVIPGSAFYQCAHLTEVRCTQPVVEVRTNAFYECTSLKNADFLEDTQIIHEDAFSGCTALEGTLNLANARTIKRNAFINCDSLTELYIDGVQNIGYCAFAYCDNLRRVELRGDHAVIESGAFSAVYSEVMEALRISGTVETIGINAFSSWWNIQHIYLEGAIKSISQGAFRFSSFELGNEAYCNVHLSDQITTIEQGAFQATNYYFFCSGDGPSAGWAEGWYSGDGLFYYGCSGILRSQEGYTYLKTPGGAFILDYTGTETDLVLDQADGIDILGVGYKAFSGDCTVERVSFGSSVKVLHDYAFSGAVNLKEVTIKYPLDDMGLCAFAESPLLTSVTIYGDVGERAFMYCNGLKTAQFFDGSIGRQALYECEELEELTLNNVKSIGSKAFYKTTKLRTVTLGERLESIGSYAFQNSGICSVTIPDSVTIMEEGAFHDAALTEVTFGSGLTSIPKLAFCGTKILSIDLPENIVSVEPSAFWVCKNLSSVTIRGSLTEISSSVFLYCTSLSEISLPASVASIGDSSFEGCASLEEIVLPSSVTSIGNSSFQGCTGLEEIFLPASVTSIGSSAFSGDSKLYVLFESDVLPDSLGTDWDLGIMGYVLSAEGTAVTDPDTLLVYYRAGDAAWIRRYSGTAAELSIDTVGNGIPVTRILSGAFSDNTNLKEVEFGPSVEQIGDSAFSDCTNLNSVEFGPSVEWIGDSAFSGCVRLMSVEIGESVEELGREAFLGCSNLKSVSFRGTLARIPNYAFFLCVSLSEIQFPDGLQEIGNSAFENCRSIKSIVLPEGLRDIEAFGFANCTQLQSIHFPENLEALSKEAFSGCKNLESVNIPKNKPEFILAFRGCPKLFEAEDGMYYYDTWLVDSEEDITVAEVRDGTTIICDEAFYWRAKLTTVILPDTVESIGNSAFWNCSGLTEFTSGSGLRMIGNKAFARCSSLSNITMSSSLTTIGDSAFESSGLTEVVLPQGLISIGTNAFKYCGSLTSVTVPNSVTSIGERAFSCTEKLEYLEIPFIGGTADDDQTLQYLFANESYYQHYTHALKTVVINGHLDRIKRFYLPDHQIEEVRFTGTAEDVIIEDNAFAGLTKVEHIAIPGTVVSIGDGAFASCQALQHIEWTPASTRIGYGAFSDCYQLKEINIGDQVEEIGRSAFSNCRSLTELVVPNSVKRIGAIALSGCDSMEFLSLPFAGLSETEPGIWQLYGNSQSDSREKMPSCLKKLAITGDIARVDGLSGCRYLEVITLPDGVETIAPNAVSYCTSLKYVKIPDTVTEIGSRAFYGSNNISCLVFPENVEKIGVEVLPQELDTLVLLANNPDFYSGQSVKNLALQCNGTLPVIPTENLVLLDKSYGMNEQSLSGLTDIHIYCCEEENTVPWPEGWSNGNAVSHADEWKLVVFFSNGTPIQSSLGESNEVIHLPDRSLYADANSDQTFIGWDANGDGSADEILVTDMSEWCPVDAVYSTVSDLATLERTLDRSCILNTDSQTTLDARCYGCEFSKILINVPQDLLPNGEFLVKTNLGSVLFPKLSDTQGLTLSMEAIVPELLSAAPVNSQLYAINLFSGKNPLDFQSVTVTIPCDITGMESTAEVCMVTDEGNRIQVAHNYDADSKKITFEITQSGIYLIPGPTPVCTQHSYESVVTAPTCTEAGFTTYTCIICEYRHTGERVEPLGHQVDIWTVIHDATCLDNGLEYGGCSRCGHSETRIIAATGHDYKAVVTAPTCTEQGYRVNTCAACGDSYADAYVDALGHDMGEWETATEATCTTDGSEHQECSRCDHYEVRIVAAPGHFYEKHMIEPTCTEGGFIEHTCSACGESYISDYTEPLGHDLSEWIVDIEATCTETGREIQKCFRCEHSESRMIDALGHDWDDGIVTIEPTEETNGQITYTCQRCSMTRTEVIHEHRYEAIVTAPTCTEHGYTTYTCRCGDSYVDSYVNALGHSFTNYVSDNNATCIQDGTKTAVCDRCDATDTMTDVGSTDGHDFSEWVVVEEPTQTTNGLESRYCYHCGIEETRSIPRQENPFTDVVEGSFYHSPVLWAMENGITNGTSATTFSPNDQCMRAQVVTFLWRAVGCPEPTRTDNPFVDVKPSDFYYKPVLWALENGITAGMDATHFGPMSYCNRAQVVTFLYRTMGSPELESTGNSFTDVQAGTFYEKPVLWAVENGITNGLSATTFGPNTICNRAQIVTFLYRAFVD